MDIEEYDALAARQECPVCDAPGLPTHSRDAEHGLWTIQCSNCGAYRISDSAIADLLQTWKPNLPSHMAMVSHRIRQLQSAQPPFVDANWLRECCQEELHFPNAFEQVENLILYMANMLGPGEQMHLSWRTCQAVVGSSSAEAFSWVLSQAESYGWVGGIPREAVNSPYEILNGYLTLAGWERFNDLAVTRQSRVAFMAMQYGDEALHKIVDDVFRPAIAQTGFELQMLIDNPTAGIIDNRLRVSIRRSRFVIADLTHHNNGAYWEAGFGEGLGLPVIYTCKDTVLSKEKGKKVHFDTRNSLIVPWDESNPAKAASELKATIRNTLPEEAILEDPS